MEDVFDRFCFGSASSQVTLGHSSEHARIVTGEMDPFPQLNCSFP